LSNSSTDQLARLRRASGLSQTELGAPLFSTSYISRLESGRRPWTWALLSHAAQRLGCKPEDILPVDQWRSDWIVPRLEAALSGDEQAAILTVGPLLDGRTDLVGARLHLEVGLRLLRWDLVEPARQFLTDACALLLSHREYESALIAGFGAIDAALRDQGPTVADQVVHELRTRTPAEELDRAKARLLCWQAEIEIQREGFGTALQLAETAQESATAAADETTALRLQAYARFELGQVELAMETADLAVERAARGESLELLTACALLKSYMSNRGGYRTRIEESAQLLQDLVDGPLRDSGRLRTAVRIELVRCLSAMSHHQPAADAARELLSSELPTEVQRAVLTRITADIAWDTGEIPRAIELFEQAHASLRGLGLRRMAARTLIGLADRLLGVGQVDQAAAVYRQALVTAGLALN
jgi:tetratricopeptide (TPR) repeat protein